MRSLRTAKDGYSRNTAGDLGPVPPSGSPVSPAAPPQPGSPAPGLSPFPPTHAAPPSLPHTPHGDTVGSSRNPTRGPQYPHLLGARSGAAERMRERALTMRTSSIQPSAPLPIPTSQVRSEPSAEVHSAIMTAAREQTGFVIAFIHRVNGGELLPEAYKVAGSGLGYITYGGPVPSEENN
eukprot:gene8973-16108_t